MKPHPSSSRTSAVNLALGLFAGAGACDSALMVEGSVRPSAGAYHYDFTINNDTPDDVLIVSLVDAPILDPLIDGSLRVPAGFLGSYDPFLGIVDFIADLEVFAAGSVSGGFSFDSLAGPGSGFFSLFSALTVDGAPLAGDVVFRARALPAPESLLLAAFGAGGLIAMGRWHRFLAVS